MRRALVLAALVPLMAGCGISLPNDLRKQQIEQQRVTNGLLACLILEQRSAQDPRVDRCSWKRLGPLLRAIAK